ncbi:RNA polymerase subunit sigma-24 [Saccharibacillus sp. O23]|uniref:RNA polymerase sigma factor n=1 Tax=Saccharibacillus sp. O23 TaxID=2009338 RepID=UPI000B4E49B2|nr:sigma-70 family RNA polymerase sigma factor [Saccharibacillus sp. O23]OWR30183.1 RNA polymerase subunit sigma-24 [Saccharibacillus sp. O23]
MNERKTEAELLRRVAQGEPEVYAEIVDRYKGKIYGLLRGMGAKHQDAEDLSQDTFVRAYRRLGELRERERFAAWLYSIAVNAMKDFAKKKRPIAAGETGMPEPRNEDTPEKLLLAEEMRRDVHRMLEALSEQERLILLLRYTNELSYEEIADMTGLRLGQVRNRLHRAKKKLHRNMQNEGGAGYEMF